MGAWHGAACDRGHRRGREAEAGAAGQGGRAAPVAGRRRPVLDVAILPHRSTCNMHRADPARWARTSRDIQPARHATCAHVAYDRQRHRPAGLSQPLWRLGPGRSHLHRDWARASHICSWTGLAPPTSAPGLGSPLPHLHRDWARPAHICTGTVPTPPTSAPRLGSPRCHIRAGTYLPTCVSRGFVLFCAKSDHCPVHSVATM